MTWREEAIAQYRHMITRLSHRIEWMRPGTFNILEDDHGRQVVTNHGDILQGEKTIANVDEIMARAEAETPKRTHPDERSALTKH